MTLYEFTRFMIFMFWWCFPVFVGATIVGYVTLSNKIKQLEKKVEGKQNDS